MAGGWKGSQSAAGGWVTWENQKETYLRKYAKQMVVVVGRGKARQMYLSDEVIKKLGHPVAVQLATRGSNVAIMPAKEGSGGYKVSYPEEQKTESAARATLASVNPLALIKHFGLAPGAYDCHLEGQNMIVFDTLQKPAIP